MNDSHAILLAVQSLSLVELAHIQSNCIIGFTASFNKIYYSERFGMVRRMNRL